MYIMLSGLHTKGWREAHLHIPAVTLQVSGVNYTVIQLIKEY